MSIEWRMVAHSGLRREGVDPAAKSNSAVKSLTLRIGKLASASKGGCCRFRCFGGLWIAIACCRPVRGWKSFVAT